MENVKGKILEADLKEKKKLVMGFDYFPTAEPQTVLDMDAEKTLEFVLYESQNHTSMESFVKDIKTWLSWVHQTNMEGIDRCFNEHVFYQNIESK